MLDFDCAKEGFLLAFCGQRVPEVVLPGEAGRKLVREADRILEVRAGGQVRVVKDRYEASPRTLVEAYA